MDGKAVKQQRQQERDKLNKSALGQMYGGDGKERYNAVPPPDYYTNADWEAAHSDAIEENLAIAEERANVRDELLLDNGQEDGEMNDINEVD